MLLALPPEDVVEELGVVLLPGEVDGGRELEVETEVDGCWGPVVKVVVGVKVEEEGVVVDAGVTRVVLVGLVSVVSAVVAVLVIVVDASVVVGT